MNSDGRRAAPPSLVWFRLDLRLADHPALATAAARGPVVPVFIWSSEEEGAAAPGAASRWWLRQSLEALDASLRQRGSRLIIRRGPALAALRALVRQTGAKSVCWSRRYEPSLVARDVKVAEGLRADGLEAETFNSALLFEPWEVKTLAGGPFKVFTPFWKACLHRPAPPAASAAPARLDAPGTWPESEPLDSLELVAKTDWAAGFRPAWEPGEKGANARLAAFVDGGAGSYHEARDFMAADGVSRLSPHLHFGEVSPRRVWDLVARCAAAAPGRGPEVYLRQLVWREFAHHLLHHFPLTVAEPLRPEFSRFAWRRDLKSFSAWTRGRTGFPAVDAGMRELWRTGWMHNRARMIAASFLVKDLLIDWRDGAAWFWDTLVDADQACNTLGWQWTAGCGADAAPFFRVFNPVLQGRKFDAEGVYVKRWIAELAALPPAVVHEPWTADPAGLAAAGAYALPLVDHARARERALDAFSAATSKDR